MKDPAKKPPRAARTAAEEKLDEEIEESFPASDPPANTPTSAGGPERPPQAKRTAKRKPGDPADRLQRLPDDERPIVVIRGSIMLGHRQSFDNREPRTSPHFGDQRFDARGRASNQRLDRAIGSVAHPAGDVSLSAARRSELTIPHPLYGAFDHEATDEG